MLREAGGVGMIEEVIMEAERVVGRAVESVGQRMVHLAEIAGYKDYFAMLISEKKLKKEKVKKHLPLFLSLVSRNDEFLLMILLSKNLFKSKQSPDY